MSLGQESSSDTLLYSSDEDIVSGKFTPTTPSHFSFSPTFTADEHRYYEDLNDYKMMNMMIMEKLDWMSDRISCIEEMVHKITIAYEQKEKEIRDSTSNLRGKLETNHATISPGDESCACDKNSKQYQIVDFSAEHELMEEVTMHTSKFLTIYPKENFPLGSLPPNGHETAPCLLSSEDSTWFSKIYLELVPYFQYIIRLFAKSKPNKAIQVFTNDSQRLKLGSLKVPDDVKIAIELRKASENRS